MRRDHGNDGARRIDRRALLRWGGGTLLTGGWVALLEGCGSGNGGVSTPRGQGRAVLTVTWPVGQALGRPVVFAAESVRVRLVAGETLLGESVLARPGNGGDATATFDGLPTGDATVSAASFPNADGDGVAQARATVAITLVAGQVTPVHLATASTVAHLDMTPAASLTVGQSITLAVHATDAAGSTILIGTSTLRWTAANASVAGVDDAGVVTAHAAGTATITVTEPGSGKSATANVIVLPAHTAG